MIDISKFNAEAWADGMAVLARFKKREQPTVVGLIRMAADIYGVLYDDIIGPRKSRHFSKPRQYVMYHAMRIGRASTHTIGAKLGGRNHATVLWGAYCHAARHDMEPVTEVIYKTRKGPKYEGCEPCLNT